MEENHHVRCNTGVAIHSLRKERNLPEQNEGEGGAILLSGVEGLSNDELGRG